MATQTVPCATAPTDANIDDLLICKTEQMAALLELLADDSPFNGAEPKTVGGVMFLLRDMAVQIDELANAVIRRVPA